MSTLLLSFYVFVFVSIHVCLHTDSVHIKFVSYGLKTMHHQYVCNHRVTNFILYLIYRYVYYLPAYRHMHTSNGLQVVTIKLKDIDDFHMAAILLFYSLQKYYLKTLHIIPRSTTKQ